MMFGFSQRRIPWGRRWSAVALVAGVVFLVLLLVVNVAGQGYTQEWFRSASYIPPSSSFPANFLRGSLANRSSCEPLLIRQGDVFRTNHSMFEYKVIDTIGQPDISYIDTPLQNCFVEEILVQIRKSLTTVLPSQFGFFPTAECLIACENPSIKLSTEYTYTNTDPLRKAQLGATPTADITFQPPSYWAQAVLIYWWDQLSVNLTDANQKTFNSTLQTVLLQALYPNDTQHNIDTDSSITTAFSLLNASQPTSFTRPPSTQFTSQHLAALNSLQIANASAEFFDTLFWAINLDLGQFSSQNIFYNPNLLADATDIFHDNDFINFTYQNTPLSDGRIPGDGYRSVEAKTVPLVQTPANIDTRFECWRWVRKPGLLALIDVVVPTAVLLAILGLLVYLFISLFYIRRTPETHQDFFLVPTGGQDNHQLPPRGINRSFDNINPEEQYLVPPHHRSGAESPQLRPSMEETIGVPYDNHPTLSQNEELPPTRDTEYRTLDPFADPQPPPRSFASSHNSRDIRGPSREQSPEIRTLQSQGSSILETPVNVFTADNLYSYRISPETAQVFDLHARRMEEEFVRPNSRLGVTPRLSQRRSSTDLKRMKAVK